MAAACRDSHIYLYNWPKEVTSFKKPKVLQVKSDTLSQQINQRSSNVTRTLRTLNGRCFDVLWQFNINETPGQSTQFHAIEKIGAIFVIGKIEQFTHQFTQPLTFSTHASLKLWIFRCTHATKNLLFNKNELNNHYYLEDSS